MAEYFSGRVHTVVWADDTKGFYVLRMVLDGKPLSSEIPVVKGSVPGLLVEVGTWFGFEGEWVQHSQYGKQISILKAPMIRGWTVDVAAGILAANGVGDRVVGLLRSHFGDELVDVLDQFNPTLLEAVPGMPPLSAAHIVSRWQSAKAHFQTLEFLSEAGVPRNKVHQVWTLFADNATEVLSTNPWALVRIDGVTFQQADEVARKLGLDSTSPLRAEGAVRYVVKTRKGLGHLYLTGGEIVAEAQALLENATPQVVAQAIATLHKAKHLVVDRQTRPGTTAIYEPWLHRMESDSADLILERAETAQWGVNEEATAWYRKKLAATGTEATDLAVDPTADLRHIAAAALRDWSKGSKVSLSGAQLQGALNALVEPVSVLTGLPGTGKTTTLKAVVSILKDADVPFLMVAPTGIAAKRITSVTGAPASTIHRAFGAQGWQKGEERESTYVGVTGQSGGLIDGSDGSGEQWGCSEVPHAAEVVICDETSMVDQHLLYRILTCTKPSARLVFIGDDKQLPSVGPGNVLRDLIASDMFPTVAMTEIFRQADTSQIVVAAHAISRGDVPEVSHSGGEFMLIPAASEDQVLELTVRLAEKLFTKRDNFQVMSPRHSSTVGVTNLNARLRELLNPKQPGLQEMRLGMEVIREDDRVMVVKNNYEREIFNGDVGKVQKLDRKAREAEIKIHGPPVQYIRLPFKDAADHLRLAYCTTVHKMQGQEADTIVMPLVVSFAHQLQRNLLYTAITRAKKRVILIGHHEALVRAIANNRPDERNTLFLDRLRIVAAARGGSKVGDFA
jgi:exodeoxyribonuclease V alpha subunit